MKDEILTFIYSNWQNIIVALAIGFVFYILSNYALRKYITSAERERLKQAKNSFLDILEGRIINKQEISTDKINNLLKAIDREHSVALSDITSPASLLQDLELRFEKSHHLDPTQKEGYCKQIENRIQEIRNREETLTVPRRYSEVLETLTEEIKSKNTEKALENLELLKKKIKEREEHIYTPSPFFRMMKENPMMFSISVIVALLFYYYLYKILFK